MPEPKAAPGQIVYIIRHGEKPAGELQGIDAQGKASEHSLIVRGWQRAGALVPFFGGSAGEAAHPGMKRPATVIAASPDAPGTDPDAQSRREEQTAGPLADRLGLTVNRQFGKGDEERLSRFVRAAVGPVLVVWEHKNIVKLTRLLSSSPLIPQAWPSERFDVVFVLVAEGDNYRFHQLPQQLLAGDAAEAIT